ncbi:hypothetical protein D9M68_968970 [compost metagenome]
MFQVGNLFVADGNLEGGDAHGIGSLRLGGDRTENRDKHGCGSGLEHVAAVEIGHGSLLLAPNDPRPAPVKNHAPHLLTAPVSSLTY